MWLSGQRDNHQLQQQRQHQRRGDENIQSTDGNLYDEAKPEVTYGQIVADPEANSVEFMASNINDNSNDAVIYSELNSNGVGVRNVAPSNDLYANVSRR